MRKKSEGQWRGLSGCQAVGSVGTGRADWRAACAGIENREWQESYAFDCSPLFQGYGIGGIAECFGVGEFPAVIIKGVDDFSIFQS